MVASSLNIVQTTAVLYVGQDVYVDELKHVKLKPGRALQKDEFSNKDLTIVLLGIAENTYSYTIRRGQLPICQLRGRRDNLSWEYLHFERIGFECSIVKHMALGNRAHNGNITVK